MIGFCRPCDSFGRKKRGLRAFARYCSITVTVDPVSSQQPDANKAQELVVDDDTYPDVIQDRQTDNQNDTGQSSGPSTSSSVNDDDDFNWLSDIKVGYNDGFLIASEKALDLQAGEFPFRLRFNGWGQLH